MSTIKITGTETVDALARQVEGADARLLAQSLNRAMQPTRTKVRRALAGYTGAPYGRVSRVVTSKNATTGRLSYKIEAEDGWLPLSAFGAREVRSGTSAAPYKVRRTFEGAFMQGGPIGARVAAPGLNGQVFVRETDARLPIKKLWGPNIAREMVRPDEAPLEAWREDVGRLQEKILREVKRRIEAGV
ncbi:MAG TPA: hypothetical protein VLA00_16375 [Xanthobacteraceae bacterium]|nr:hypothetical protein [Xanthobacteraceae bacterium]